jgi:hypothetical protein
LLPNSSQPLAEAFADLKADVEQLDHAEWNHADNLLRRVVSHFADETELGRFTARSLPEVDYTNWFHTAQSSMGAVAGAGRLDWPLERAERVAMQLAALRQTASSSSGIVGFGLIFFQGNYPVRTAAFVQNVVVPFYQDLLRVAMPSLEAETPTKPSVAPAPRRTGEPAPFIAFERIEELRALSSHQFDLRKLVRLCEELNVAWEHRCFLTVGMLTRAIIDHVPPAFGFRTFTEVTNNFAGGRSKKSVFERLENLARKIADDFLHATMKDRESLPTDRQVDLSVEIDVLLGEVASIAVARERSERT